MHPKVVIEDGRGQIRVIGGTSYVLTNWMIPLLMPVRGDKGQVLK